MQSYMSPPSLITAPTTLTTTTSGTTDITGYSSEINCSEPKFDGANFELVKSLKQSFAHNEFADKYQKILAKTEDTLIKTETIKLSTATIMQTLRGYFNKEDPEDTTQLNEYMDNIIRDNIELGHCINKLNQLKEKQKSQDVINELENDDDIEIEIEDNEPELPIELIAVREEQSYQKTKQELNKLINKRLQEVVSAFPHTDQDTLDQIFNTHISTNKKKSKKTTEIANNNKDDYEEDNEESFNWESLDAVFDKYNIPRSVVSMLHGLEDFKKELNDTHDKFVSIGKTIEQFNNVITAQINWVSNMPDFLDNSTIMENIESTIKKYFDAKDVIKLFQDYKETYMKMMLMITFVPHQFVSKDTCAICLTNENNIVFVPCGHTCCGSCSGSISSCMVCRTKIDKKQKIYKC